MKKHLFTVLILSCLASFNCHAQTPVEKHGQLSVVGNKVVDKNGNAVQLRGMSLFWSQWMGDFYNQDLVKWLANDWCISVIRAAMAVDSSVGGYATDAYTADVEQSKVITVVDAAIAQGIYVIIDFHSHYASLPANKAAAKTFFAYMSAKYKGVPNIIYEPWNEPISVDWATVIKPYHEEIIDIIRANDTNNIIVCGSRNWDQQVDEASDNPINKPNIAYSLHFYAGTHKQALRDIAQYALDGGIALFVTEYGTCDASGNGGFDSTETRTWWNFLDLNNISYCNWSVADKAETASILLPGGSTDGGWSASDLSESGTLVKSNLISKCETPNGIDNSLIANNKSVIFPNPFTNTISITTVGAFNYQIMDLHGNIVSTGNAINTTTLGSELSNGLYMIKINHGTSFEYIKAIKSN